MRTNTSSPSRARRRTTTRLATGASAGEALRVASLPGTHALTEACRAQLAAIDLHFHDLRHEAASKLYEGGWPLLRVSEMLGHADLKTTQFYLNIAANGLHESMRKFEEAKQLAGGGAGTDHLRTSPGCRPVASEAQVEHPPSRNGEPHDSLKVIVN